MSDPKQIDSLVAFLASATHLKQLPRSGWLFAGVAQPESIAEHTCVMALLVLELGTIINEDLAAQGLEQPLDLAHATRMALLHDLAESQLTDLPKRSTQLLGSETKHRAEEEGMRAIIIGLPTAKKNLALWQEYAACNTPEARLLKDADRLEMVHQALFYERRGQTNLGEFWQQSGWHYAASSDLFEALRTLRP